MLNPTLPPERGHRVPGMPCLLRGSSCALCHEGVKAGSICWRIITRVRNRRVLDRASQEYSPAAAAAPVKMRRMSGGMVCVRICYCSERVRVLRVRPSFPHQVPRAKNNLVSRVPPGDDEGDDQSGAVEVPQSGASQNAAVYRNPRSWRCADCCSPFGHVLHETSLPRQQGYRTGPRRTNPSSPPRPSGLPGSGIILERDQWPLFVNAGNQ